MPDGTVDDEPDLDELDEQVGKDAQHARRRNTLLDRNRQIERRGEHDEDDDRDERRLRVEGDLQGTSGQTNINSRPSGRA